MRGQLFICRSADICQQYGTSDYPPLSNGLGCRHKTAHTEGMACQALGGCLYTDRVGMDWKGIINQCRVAGKEDI